MSKLHRTLTLIAVVVGAAAAIVLFSRILLTLDELQSPEIRIAYALGVAAILVPVGLLLYRRFRPAARSGRPAAPPRPGAEARLDRLFARHRLETNTAATPPLRHRPAGDPATIALCGFARTGQSSLAAALAAALPASLKGHPLSVVETPALGTDFAANLECIAPALAADVTLFVADQDLRDYEFAVIKALAERGAAPIVVLNKADQRDAVARQETRDAVTRRLASLVAEADVVEAAADPLPLLQIIADTSGHTVEAEAARPPDVARVAVRVLARLDPSSRS